MSVIGVKTKNGVRYDGLSSYDDTQLRNLVNQKVDKQSGKSLISDTQIQRLSEIENYDDTQLRQLVNSKVTAVSGYSLVSNEQIQRLANVDNYNDTEIRQVISSSSANITQAVLNCQIPNDPNAQTLDVTIKLCPNIDMQTDLIQINNLAHYQIMSIGLDTEFVPLSEYYYEGQVGSPKIPYSYFTGTLTVKLTAETVEGFNPNASWYVVVIWSNGNVTSQSQMIQFKYSGFCRMPRNN